MGKWCLHASLFIFDRIIIKVAGNQDRHKSSVKLDFGPNQTTHFGVVAVLCPWARHFTPRKYWLITQEAMAPSRHDWKIVDWDVKPQHNQIILELLALEWRKFHTFELEYLWSQLVNLIKFYV